MGTLYAFLGDGAAAHPERPWLVCDGQSWTYGEGAAICDRLAAGLARQGVRAGDRVGLLFTNCAEIVFCYFACFRLGAVAVPVNTRFQTPELIHALSHCGARVLIGQAALCAPLLERRAELPALEAVFVTGTPLPGALPYDALLAPPGDAAPRTIVERSALAALLYTSGTTARPKGVIHSHASLTRQSANYLAVLGHAVYARIVVFVPLCHISGFSILLLTATGAGGTIWIVPRFDPETVLRTLQESRCTYSGALPVMINALVNHPGAANFDLSSLLHFPPAAIACRWSCSNASRRCGACRSTNFAA